MLRETGIRTAKSTNKVNLLFRRGQIVSGRETTLKLRGAAEAGNALSVEPGKLVDVECEVTFPAGPANRGLARVRVGDGGPDLRIYTYNEEALTNKDGKFYVTLMTSPNNEAGEEEPAVIGLDCTIDKGIRSRVPKSWLGFQMIANRLHRDGRI